MYLRFEPDQQPARVVLIRLDLASRFQVENPLPAAGTFFDLYVRHYYLFAAAGFQLIIDPLYLCSTRRTRWAFIAYRFVSSHSLSNFVKCDDEIFSPGPAADLAAGIDEIAREGRSNDRILKPGHAGLVTLLFHDGPMQDRVLEVVRIERTTVKLQNSLFGEAQTVPQRACEFSRAPSLRYDISK